MEVRGETLIGRSNVMGNGPAFHGFDPASRVPLAPEFSSSTPDDLDRACALAAEAYVHLRETPPEDRSRLLETIAARLEDAGETIIARAMAETGLPEPRLRGELARTCGQLHLFARVVGDGGYLDVRIDHALTERTPPRPDIRLMQVPLGPVAVFGASNFPLAFSVAGGDTASALAAGCPVVVKAHSAHPGTSELAGKAISQAVEDCGLHEGVFSMVFGSGAVIGTRLVADPRIQAVGFTGSRAGGTALVEIARARPVPIPVYAEMSSVNPVILLPGALAERGEAVGQAFSAAQTLGAGQFCTNPGLLLAIDGPDIDAFVAGVRTAYAGLAPQVMLTPGIHEAFCSGVEGLAGHERVRRLAAGAVGEGFAANAMLFETTAKDFIADRRLVEEVFGPASLLVRCSDADELVAVIEGLEGQLTAAIHATEADGALAGRLVPLLEQKAGRILFDGFGTGVEVCHGMVHGGPYPATSDSRSTSVGSLAIRRFLRPVSYQNVPGHLLPEALKDDNPYGLPRLIDGQRE